MKDIKPIFRTGKYKEWKVQIKTFRRPFPMDKPTLELEAVFLQVGYKGFWIFRNYDIWSKWPSQA